MNKLYEHQAANPAAARSASFASVHPGYMAGVVFCVCATVLMGVMFPVMTSALRRVDPFTFT